MPSTSTEVPLPSKGRDDSELERLLCLASAFQTSQCTTGNESGQVDHNQTS